MPLYGSGRESGVKSGGQWVGVSSLSVMPAGTKVFESYTFHFAGG